MCRSTDYHGVYNQDRHRLKIKSFSLRLSLSSTSASDVIFLPESLTLLLLPRINGSALDVNGSKIRPDSPAVLTLHRTSSDVVFTSKDRIRGSDGLTFEVHLGQQRFIKGVFRNSDYDDLWRMECKCVLDAESVVADVIREAEVTVETAADVMREKIAVAKRRTRRRRRCRGFTTCLEEIPEERDYDVVESDESEQGSDVACCCDCSEGECESDGEDEFDDEELMEVEKMELEGVRWAVDVGFWVMCVGVGLLVTRASAKRFRRRRFLY